MRRVASVATLVVLAALLTGCLGSGTYQVTPDLHNGTAAVGLWHSFGGTYCYWERLRGFSGEFSDIIENSLTDAGPQYVEIKPEDAGFHTQGCSSWVQAGGPLDKQFPASNGQFPGEGEFRVGVEVPPGTYQAQAPTRLCYWVRESNFADEGFSEGGGGIANGLNENIVTIADTDVGFRTQGCGTWVKIG